MYLSSRAGIPLQFEVNESDIRIFNSVYIDTLERNMIFMNGILHNMVDFPANFPYWRGKSTYEIMLETNDQRHGDLSSFIDLIDASVDLKNKMLLLPGMYSVFCFTNEALSGLSLFDKGNSSGVIDPSSDLHEALLNHFVSGVFARNVWKELLIGTNTSDTELEEVVTLGGQSLNLVIEPGKHVIINGQYTVIVDDIFSVNGVLHVIDKPLLFD
jgi:uncharacterized surface protein with fasciclin (FAS1) repeats